MATLTSKIIEQENEKGISGLYIELWQYENKIQNLINTAITTSDGSFQISFDENDFSGSATGRNLQAFLKIYEINSLPNGILIKDTQETPFRLSLSGTNIPSIAVDLVANERSAQTRRITGQIAQPNGRGISNQVVKAFGQSVEGEIFLSSTKTDTNGNYTLYYQHISAVRQNNDIDLIVKVYDNLSAKDPLIESPLIINAEDDEIVNLVIGDSPFRGLDLYTQIHEALEKSVKRLTLEKIGNREIYYLSKEYELPIEDIISYIQARQWFSSWNKLPSEIYFAWFKIGLSKEWAQLFSTSVIELKAGIDKTVETNIITESFLSYKEGLEEKLVDWRTDNFIDSNGMPLHRGSIGQLFKSTQLSDDETREFIKRWQTFDGKVENFWKEQQENLGEDTIKDVELTLQLGAITRNHVPLINELKERHNVKQLRDLGLFQEGEWLELLDNKNIIIPEDIQGRDSAERKRTFAKSLQTMTEATIPTAVLTNSFRQDPEIESKSFDLFFYQNTRFEFRDFSVNRYLDENPEALAGIDDPIAFTKELQAMQRVFHLTPVEGKKEVAKVLWKNQLHSAFAIKMAGEDTLMSLFEGQETMANRIFQKASYTQYASQAVKMQFYDTSASYMPVTPLWKDLYKALQDGEATLESLFGDQGYCQCKHCASFFSPAAYLVDLFLYLNKAKVDANNSSPDEDTVLERLFKRRPDLGNIELDCDNSHTPTPYIDIVNEVLENAIVIKNYVNTQIKIFGKTFTLPITEVPQTEIDTATLKAYPQHLNPTVYDVLHLGEQTQGITFPWNLPFNLWMEEVRVYLNHLGVPRHQLMEILPGGSTSEATIATEYLQLLPEERIIITDTSYGDAKISSYWGTTISQLSKVSVFLKQSGFLYKELQQLLMLRFIQSTSTSGQITISYDPPSSCEINNATFENTTNVTFSRIHRLGRLYKKADMSLLDLDRILMTFDEEIDDRLLITIAKMKKVKTVLPRKISNREILSWWSPLETYSYLGEVSLYAKLFLNPSVNKPFAQQFELNSTGDELNSPGTIIDLNNPSLEPDLLAIILGATRLNAKDLKLLVEAELSGGVITLNLGQLSYLYRVSSFCHSLKWKISDFLVFKTLLNTNPLASPDSNTAVFPEETLKFIEITQIFEKYEINTSELNYLLRHQFNDKSSFATKETELSILLQGIHNQLNYFLNESYPVGTTLKEIVNSKLSRVLPVEILLNAQKIIEENSVLNVQDKKDFFDENFTFFTDLNEAKLQLIDGGITNSEERYEYILNALDHYLAENIIIQQVAEGLQALPQFASLLLQTYLSHPSQQNQSALQVFLDPIFLETQNSETWTSQQFPGQFSVLVQVSKIAFIIEKFRLKIEDLMFLMEKGQTANLPDLRQLPVEVQPSVPVGNVKQYVTLIKVVKLNQRKFDEEHSIYKILDTTQNVNSSQAELLTELHESTGWEMTDIEYLTSSEALNLNYPIDYQTVDWLINMGETLDTVNQIGVTAQQATSWISESIIKQQADSVRHAVKAKYGDEQWLEVTVPLRDKLRVKQRDALLDYVLHYVKKHDQKTFKDADDVYEYFLMDMQIAPCTMTSRIVLAASTVQLFVQRIMMSLEPEMHFKKKFMKEWQWRKYYRVWEANRKVFMWPENWIEPELRDDKTPFFQEMENELMQDQLSPETVERAYTNYLFKLDNTARMQICGSFEDDEKTLHVIARTHGTPAEYYYRRWIDKSYWTAWEKIELDIYNAEGIDPAPSQNILLPVMHNRRLYLFWPILKFKHVGPSKKEKGEIKFLKNWISQIKDGAQGYANKNTRITELEGIIAKKEAGHDYYEVRMAWSYYQDGGWHAKKVSEMLPSKYFEDGFDKPESYVFIPKFDSNNNLFIRWYYLKSKTIYKFKSYFVFDQCKGYLSTYKKSGYKKLGGKLYKEMQFMKYKGKAKEAVTFINMAKKEVTLLHEAPIGYLLSFSSQKSLHRTNLPLFYEDKGHTFFIIPPQLKLKPHFTLNTPTSLLASNSNVLQESVYQMGTIETEEVANDLEIVSSEGLSISTFDNQYFGANNSNEVVVRSSNIGDNHDLSFEMSPANQDAMAIQPNMNIFFPEGDYKFQTFYHPYTCLMIKHLKRFGVEGLLNSDTKEAEGKQLNYQLTPNHLDSLNFLADYKPYYSEVKWKDSPKDLISFDFDEAYATYNWELFFHIPLFIATRLSQDQRFEEAQKWFHYIFNPTETEGVAPYRFWKIRPFHKYTTKQIMDDIEALMGGDISLKKQVEAWERDPFNPHLIARFRKLAYMKSVVMKYLDNLISWGDQLFRRDSIESINEATQIYVLAAQILGKLPIETESKQKEVKTFNELAPDLTMLGNAWVDLETNFQSEGSDNENGGDQTGGVLDDILYFCISPNEKLLAYWDTIADRLFKIRNCMNIEGLTRELPLFQPPIDPALLVKAVAAGIDLSSAINDLYAPLPHYRFSVMIQSALGICQEVKSLGNSLLSALEKKDSEMLTLLHANNEIALLNATKDIKVKQVEEARLSETVLLEAKELVKIRKEDYEEREFISTAEITSFALARSASITQSVGVGLLAGGGAAHQAPDQFVGGLAGPMGGAISLTHITGGNKVGTGIETTAKWLEFASIILRDQADASSTYANYKRRQEDWDLQVGLAEQELKQIEKQLLETHVRISIAEKDQSNLDLQIENTKLVSDHLRNKYTQQQLYNWMIGQVSSTYFKSYQLAYDIAKQAEKTFRFELGVESSNYIKFGYWDNMKKGLLSGEKLYHDLKRLEMAYLEKNKRNYEITKHIPISFISPDALLKLKETGVCEFNIPELLFDLDFPGQYFRRIKSVSITIPCIVGPYTSVSAKLTLLRNRVRKNGNSQSEYAYTGLEDANFIHDLVGMQSVATSQAQGDNGMFELNFRDERYLPFEGAGAISRWKLELPTEFHSFDYDSISDIIMHVNYTAREGGDALKQTVNTHVNDSLNKWMNELSEEGTGLLRLMSMKQEFSGEWHRFSEPKAIGEGENEKDVHQLPFEIKPQHFPYFLRGKELGLTNVKLILKLKEGEDNSIVINMPVTLKKGVGESADIIAPLTENGLQTGIANLPSLSYDLDEDIFGWWQVEMDNADIPEELKIIQSNNNATPAFLNQKKIEDMYLIFNYMIG